MSGCENEDKPLQTKKRVIRKNSRNFFVLEVTARSAADLLDIYPNSTALFYRKIREVISYHLTLQADEIFDGHVELDESYFGGRRKGKRGLGAIEKAAVFGILKCGGEDFLEKIRQNAVPESVHRANKDRPIISRDPYPDQYGIPSNYLDNLQKSIILGGGK